MLLTYDLQSIFIFTDLKNAFKLENPKQQWMFSAASQEEKFNWISLVEQSVRAALQG